MTHAEGEPDDHQIIVPATGEMDTYLPSSSQHTSTSKRLMVWPSSSPSEVSGRRGGRLGAHRDGCCRELDTIDIVSQREVAGGEFTALARECA